MEREKQKECELFSFFGAEKDGERGREGGGEDRGRFFRFLCRRGKTEIGEN